MFRINLDEREVRLVIAGDVVRVVSFAAVGCYVNYQVRRARDHMLIGHDITRWVDNESRTGDSQRSPDRTRTSLVLAETLRIKISYWIASSWPADSLGGSI